MAPQTALMQGKGELIGLAVLRSETEGATSSRDRSVFAQGAYHAQTAIRMQRAMAHRGEQLLTGSLESLGLAAFLLDRDGRVAGLTPQAEAIARRPGGMPLTVRERRLRAPASQTALARAIDEALKQAARVQTLWLEDPSDRQAGRLCDVVALPRRDYAFGFDPKVIVIIREPRALTQHSVDSLRCALGLTPAEADIAIALANGLDRREIAQGRGTSSQTLSTQVKALLSKSDVRREGELIALVNRLMR